MFFILKRARTYSVCINKSQKQNKLNQNLFKGFDINPSVEINF